MYSTKKYFVNNESASDDLYKVPGAIGQIGRGRLYFGRSPPKFKKGRGIWIKYPVGPPPNFPPTHAITFKGSTIFKENIIKDTFKESTKW